MRLEKEKRREYYLNIIFNMEKANVFKNFIYSFKKIWAIDKLYFLEYIIKAIVQAAGNFVYPYILKIAVEGVEKNKEFKQIVIEVLIVIGIAYILSVVKNFLSNDIEFYRRKRISTILTREFYFKSLNTDYEKFERKEIQDDFEKASRGVQSINEFMNQFFLGLGNLLTFIIACAIIVEVSIFLIIIIVMLAIFKMIIADSEQKWHKKYVHNKTTPIWRRITYSDNISRNLTIGKDLRVYEMNKFIDKERARAVGEINNINKNWVKRHVGIYSILFFISALDELALYSFMVYEVIKYGMSIATFTFMVSSVRSLVNAMNNLINRYGNMVNNSLRVNDYRKFEQYDLQFDCEEINDIEKLESIEFENVSYSYYLQDGFALKNVSFKINKGEKIALVGFNGAGKTTLIKLLCGLYHPTEGRILLNGIDIEKISRKNLGRLMAPVFQDVMHYAISVEENVSMKHSQETDEEEVKKAIELVGLKHKIESLPNDIKTVITRDLDERGIDLSGGENQKLAIARAVYKKAELVILDEPTSALDAISEHDLYLNFNEMIKGKMAIFISHRLSSTRFCNRIFFLEEGKLLETGSHEELMNYNSKYKELFDMQAEYYKGGDENED